MCPSNESRDARSFERREIHAVSCARADKSRSAHVHLANRRGHLLDGANFFDHKIVRQKSLIDQLDHAFIVRLTPDGPEMFAANFHNPEDGLRAVQLARLIS